MHWRAQTAVFSDVAAVSVYPQYLNYMDGDTPEQITASRVSESYFRVLDVPLARGRPFTVEEDSPGGTKVAAISYDFWQRRLGGSEDVLGKALPLRGDSYEIVASSTGAYSARPLFRCRILVQQRGRVGAVSARSEYHG
jgi:hypothetical protein